MQQVLAMSEQHGDGAGVSDALGVIADIYTSLGDFDKAGVVRPRGGRVVCDAKRAFLLTLVLFPVAVVRQVLENHAAVMQKRGGQRCV